MQADQDLIEADLSTEEYREYEWPVSGDQVRIYRIDRPSRLFYRNGGATHRVVDANGVAHCVPAVGRLGCVLRWKTKDSGFPVNF